jgi:putative ubiquitin-RnfH superfamily antitoxin RatB of RatAB toxin-antitoxin module
VSLHVEVVRASPGLIDRVALLLAEEATVADALIASGWSLEGIDAYAIFGERVQADTRLQDGDRLELLRPLQIDPKEARRKRARHR